MANIAALSGQKVIHSGSAQQLPGTAAVSAWPPRVKSRDERFEAMPLLYPSSGGDEFLRAGFKQLRDFVVGSTGSGTITRDVCAALSMIEARCPHLVSGGRTGNLYARSPYNCGLHMLVRSESVKPGHKAGAAASVAAYPDKVIIDLRLLESTSLSLFGICASAFHIGLSFSHCGTDVTLGVCVPSAGTASVVSLLTFDPENQPEEYPRESATETLAAFRARMHFAKEQIDFAARRLD